MRSISKTGRWWIAVAIFLSFLGLIFLMSTRGETKLKVTSPDGRFVAYGVESPDWVDVAAFLLPPLQSQTGCRFIVTDTRSGRTQKLFGWTLNYDLDGAFEMATVTPRAYNIYWSPDSTTVVCTLRAQRQENPKYDDFHTSAFATNKTDFAEVPAATAWVAEHLFQELQSADASRRAIAEQLIKKFDSFHGGVGHFALWCTRKADTTTLKGWGEKLKESQEFGYAIPYSWLAEDKSGVRRTVLGGKPKPYQSVYVNSAWNARGLFLSVQASGALPGCTQEVDILQNGCSSVRVRLSRDGKASPKEYVFARVNGRSTTLAGTTGKSLTTSKSARCVVHASAPSTGGTISDGFTDWQSFIPWDDFGVLPEDVRSGRRLSFAMTVIAASASGTTKTEWSPEVDSVDRDTRLPKSKLFLMP